MCKKYPINAVNAIKPISKPITFTIWIFFRLLLIIIIRAMETRMKHAAEFRAILPGKSELTESGCFKINWSIPMSKLKRYSTKVITLKVKIKRVKTKDISLKILLKRLGCKKKTENPAKIKHSAVLTRMGTKLGNMLFNDVISVNQPINTIQPIIMDNIPAHSEIVFCSLFLLENVFILLSVFTLNLLLLLSLENYLGSAVLV